MWLKSLIIASLLQVGIAGAANAAGPFGSVNIGNWIGGAFSNDQTGAFSHCAATTPYANGVILVVSQNSAGTGHSLLRVPATVSTRARTPRST